MQSNNRKKKLLALFLLVLSSSLLVSCQESSSLPKETQKDFLTLINRSQAFSEDKPGRAKKELRTLESSVKSLEESGDLTQSRAREYYFLIERITNKINRQEKSNE